MKKLANVLLFSLFVGMLFAELARIPLVSGVSISLIDISAIFIFLYVFLREKSRKLVFKNPLFKPILIFVVVCTLSLLANIHWLTPSQIAISFLYTVRFITFTGIYFFINQLDSSARKRIPFFLILVGTLITVFGFIQYFYIDFTTLSFLDWDIHWYRLFSTFIDPNFAGVFLSLTFLLSLYQLLEFPNKKNKLFYFLCVESIILLIGIILTFSRTALVALIAGLISYGLFIKKGRKILLGAIFCLLLGIGIVLANYQATEGTKLFRISSSTARLTSISSTLTIIKDNPILGIGFNAFRYARHKYGYAVAPNWEFSHSDAGTDNSFLFVLATTGVVGIISFLYLLYTMYSSIVRSTNATKYLCLASGVALIVSSFFLNTLFYPLIFAWIWIIIALIDPLSP